MSKETKKKTCWDNPEWVKEWKKKTSQRGWRSNNGRFVISPNNIPPKKK